MKPISIKRALISVSNKTGVVDFAKALVALNVEIISTGGTSQLLREAQIPHQEVGEITGLPEMLDGRVKTLHPRIHGGILGKRDRHAVEVAKHQIDWIDLVVVNFYPFADAVKSTEMPWDDVVEYIDIGGPTMVRAAAKNFAWVGVIVDPNDYEGVLNQLRAEGLDFAMRQQLAEKAFALTSSYDAMIHQYFLKRSIHVSSERQQVDIQLEKLKDLRYGENPHQKACAYQFKQKTTGILSAIQHQGKQLSYNNILDSEAALTCVSEFDQPTCVIVKHANPCGVSQAETIDEAYLHAYEADALSAFGGVIALNRPCTKKIAEAISHIFMEVILAPSYSEEALAIFAAKPNLRVIELPTEKQGQANNQWEMKFITGGVLMQEKDLQVIDEHDLQIVTEIKPSKDDIKEMLFAWRVLKHIKSNGIVITKDHTTVGIGAGQVSRVDAVHVALRKAHDNLKNTILASDAFFPFSDSIDLLANTGIRSIIQPGGSVRDEEVIAACNKNGIAMVFTGKRCFKH